MRERERSILKFEARCNMTGKRKVHNFDIRISTVPLRLMLRHNLIPGWRKLKWEKTPEIYNEKKNKKI